jgi:hypothetical protein
LKVPVLAGVLASEPDNARTFLARAVAADVCEPQLAPVFRDDPAGEVSWHPFIGAFGKALV